DSGGYSAANMKSYNDANISWISRVPETSTAAKDVLEQEPEQWIPLSDGSGVAAVRVMDLPQGKERWVLVRPFAQQLAAREHMQKKVNKTQQQWEKRLWHLSKQAFTCENDAHQGWKQALKGKPDWVLATYTLQEEKHYQQRGRPKRTAPAEQTVWHLVPTLC